MAFIEVLVPSAAENSLLSEIVDAVRPAMVVGQSLECVERAERLGRESSSGLARIASPIAMLAEHRGSTGVLLVDLQKLCGPEIAALPPTPLQFVSRDEHQLTTLDVVRCALIGAADGYSYSYTSQANGTLSDDVFPLQSYAERSGFSGGKDLGWHTEDAAFNRSAGEGRHPAFDVFSFAYLRNPNDDPTLVSMPDLSRLEDSILEQLRLPQFVAKTSISHEGDRNTVPIPTSYVYGADKMRFSFARLDELQDIYKNAGLGNVIDAFIKHLDSSSAEIPGIPGTIAFLDNMRVAHARGTWKKPPQFDGTDRWQRRIGFAKPRRKGFLQSLMRNPEERLIDRDLLVAYLSTLPPS